MSLELIDPSKEFTLSHPSGAEFRLRYWTKAMQEEVEKQCIKQDGKGGAQYDFSREKDLKIDLSLISWSGVTLEGTDVPCTAENKAKLPIGVMIWLIREIDERAGLRMTEEEKKN